MNDPKVVDPPDFDIKAGWDSCGGEDPGCCDCPACKKEYWSFGKAIECTCGFTFPTEWWPIFSKGFSEGRRIKESGSELSAGMRNRMENPYYKVAFDVACNGPIGEGVSAWNLKDGFDWKAICSGWSPIGKPCIARGISDLCERCGEEKSERRKTIINGLCSKCEAETSCRHRCSMLEKCCSAGVVFAELRTKKTSDYQSLPCYYVSTSIPVTCDKFEPRTVEEVEQHDRDVDASVLRFLTAGPIIQAVKETHKGKDWNGVEECPVCKGRLHLSHSAFNGHVWGKCETEDCLAWME